MIILTIILAITLLISVSFNLYMHHQSLQTYTMISHFRDNAVSEIDYLEVDVDQLKETIGKVDYRQCASTLERMAKTRGTDKMILLGQTEGLREAAVYLRHEAKRIGIK